MNPIDALFQRLRSQGRKAFIPFLTAGDPDLAATGLLARTLADRGAHLLEIGFPYSDPIADGPVIQASYTRALERGVRVEDIFAAVAYVRCQGHAAGGDGFLQSHPSPRRGEVSGAGGGGRFQRRHRAGPAVRGIRDAEPAGRRSAISS